MTKSYELPLTRDYVRNWTAVEAIRELLQNNLDHGKGVLTYFLDEEYGMLRLYSVGAKLDKRTLLLGATSKAKDEAAIGSFGEGYKIAMLVLAREGVRIDIYNNDVVWRPRLGISESFGEEVLFVDESSAVRPDNDVLFIIRGLTSGVVKKVKENTLHMQDDVERIQTNKGDVLLNRPGKLYVNGLYVTETGLEYGYDVKPQFLKLERDRQTVSSFDVKFLSKDMLFQAFAAEEIAEKMAKGTEDLEYAQYGTPELIKEAVYQHFIRENPGAVVASSNDELKKKVAAGFNKVVVYSRAYAETVEKHNDYASEPPAPPPGPSEIMREFFTKNCMEMNSFIYHEFKELVKVSEGWKLK